MDLWIRSQDKKFLKKCDDISFQDFSKATSTIGGIHRNDLGKLCIIQNCNEGYICLGRYLTEERVIEVLDKIQKHINPDIYYKNGFGECGDEITIIPKNVFEMPLE